MSLNLNSLLNEFEIPRILPIFADSKENQIFSIDPIHSDLIKLILSLHIFNMNTNYKKINNLVFETNYIDKFNSINPELIQIFYYLTSRRININFKKTDRINLYMKPLNYINMKDVLFSGGLDSLCGAFNISEEDIPILIHVITNDRILHTVKNLHSKTTLKQYPLIFLDTRSRAINEGPNDTRGLLFLTFAFAIASFYRLNEIIFPENGSQMLDVMLSSIAYPNEQATKNTNPVFLNMCERFFTIFNEKKFKIIKMFIQYTKAEVIAKYRYKLPFNLTHSCFRTQGISNMCGLCYNCFLRRMSLLSLDINDDNNYEINPYIKYENTSKIYKERQGLLYQLMRFYYKVIINDYDSVREIDLSSKGIFNNPVDLAKRFALDVFLGAHNALIVINQENMNGLALKVRELLSKIDVELLESRKEELKKIRWF